MDINRIKEQAHAYEALADSYNNRVQAKYRDNSAEQPIGPQELEVILDFFKAVFSVDEDNMYGPIKTLDGLGSGTYKFYERTVKVPRVGALVLGYQMETETRDILQTTFTIDVAESEHGDKGCELKTAVDYGGDLPVTELMCLNDNKPYPRDEILDAVETVTVLRQQLNLG